MPNDATRATASPLSNDPLAPHGRMSYAIDMAALRRMSMKELHDFRDAVHTLAAVICGLCCQPRFFGTGEIDYNETGNALDMILDFLNGYEQAAVNVAAAARPTDLDDVKCRAWALLSFNADMVDNLATFASLANEMKRDEAEAKFREQHQR